ncbi:MAG: FtsX-like permease family protein [Deltaproteobacteria bacterium]|nr:FtsX-like permease family protein [Deltaproteobacteria bacterium]
MNRRFVLQMIRRETRASRRQLLLYGSCMALGIASLVGLHGMRAATQRAVDAQSQRLLGADLRIESRRPIKGAAAQPILDLEDDEQTQSTRMTRFGSMALALNSGRSRLVDIQAVESNYPLHGAVTSEPADHFAQLHRGGRARALVDSSLLIQLDTEIGETLAIGDVQFEIVGTIGKAPGSFGMQTQIAPRVLIPLARVVDTGLIRPGSLVQYLVFFRLEPERLGPWLERNRAGLEDTRLKLTTVQGYQNELNRSFGVLTRYLGLVGLAALALGGVGVAAGIRVFVREKLESVALLRSLGASSRDIFAVYGALAMGLGALAGLAGSLVGVVLQWVLPLFMQGLLPVDVPTRFEPMAVVTGIVLGLWVTLLFAAGPLIDLVRVPPLRALRADYSAEPIPIGGRFALVVALGLSLIGVSLWQAPRYMVGLWFAAGLAAALAALAAAAKLSTMWLRGRAFRRTPYWMRQGIANLFRPMNHTLSSVLTIGFGLFLVLTLHGVQVNVMQQIAIDTQPNRPNLVLFDVQPDQVEPVKALLSERGATITDRAPLISARISSVGGRTISDWLAGAPDDRGLRWALQREYRLTYSALLRDTEVVVRGSWWDGTPVTKVPIPVSLETSIEEDLGVAVGDSITWDIQGVPVESIVTSVREVNWDTLATNFFVVLPPGMIEQAPHTTVLLARLADDTARAELQRDLVREFSNVSVLDASVILSAIDTMMARMATAIRLLAMVTLATGMMILVAATVSARQERAREVLLLRTLGASGATLRRILGTEVVALGALSASVGSLIAIASSWGLVRFVFELPFDPPWSDFAVMALVTVAISALLGALGAGRMRRMSPLASLRGS